MFIPTTRAELEKLNWPELDVILISGDTYTDTSFNGAAVIGKVLLAAGFRVGIIAQPDIESSNDITRLGEPRLFWGVTAGAVDSMVANYTASKKKRKTDDFTPGGINNRRPDRATIAYTNLIRKNFKNTCPIVLGGIEASLRRIAHYDFWSNKIRRSLLFDAKADILIYGMGERSVVELANALADDKDYKNIDGICYIDKEAPADYLILPSYEEAVKNKRQFKEMFMRFYNQHSSAFNLGMVQQHGDRFLVHNRAAAALSREELDTVYELDYERDAHPYYKNDGKITALDTIRFSVTSHRGCFGNCNFCAIAVHQGKRIIERSPESIIRELKKISQTKGFKGIISDLGGPTANMYGMGCSKNKNDCKRRCLYPTICPNLLIDHKPVIDLLRECDNIPGIKKIFVASGIRYDLILADKKHGDLYLRKILADHTSGQLKIAPEHSEQKVLAAMGKPQADLQGFRERFYKITKSLKLNQFLTYYFMAAHPGCTLKDMQRLKGVCERNLQTKPQQVQIFTPTPATCSTLMYYLGEDLEGRQLEVERDPKKRELQKDILTTKRG